MNFKQLELAGFKSFADRIQIKFDDGVTAIVGPNGCGKSNVADAIRWVLGEQSSKTLRGSSMQDVIFSGTEKRKSLSYCEVTMTFDNSDRFFNYDFDEIAITRKLYRSGESEYQLNKTSCRLKDITNLLYDSGLGKDGYSIIGQDQVGKILSSKPEDRRSIFEDAAGISKYKSRKIDAERKLERTKDNILKLQLVIDEIERQLGPLKKQSEDAKKFLELKDVLKNLEINAYIYQYENASDLKAKITSRLDAISEELELRQKELEEVSKNYSDNMEGIETIDKTVERIHENILDLTIAIEKQAGETNVVKERIKILKEQNKKLELDSVNYDNLISAINSQIQERAIHLSETNEKLENYKNEEEELSREYLKTVDELNLNEDEAESTQKEMFDALDKLTNIKSNSSRLDAEKQASKESLQEIKSRILNTKEKLDNQNKIKESLKNKIQDLKIQNQKQLEIILQGKLEINSKQDNLANFQKEIQNCGTKIQVYENRKRILEEMQAEHEGYAGSIKKILKESEKNSEFRKKMVGVLASLISVPEKFEMAIETALGNALQNIVTKNEQDAKSIIEFLKQGQFGRATFLPISSMKTRTLSQQDTILLKTEGCFGIAKDLISYEGEIENVISNLLGLTVIVTNLDVAIKLAQNSKFSFKIVTLEGDVINPQGSMTGGSKKSEAVNLISRDREIKTLGEEIEKLKTFFDGSSEKIKSLKNDLDNSIIQVEFLTGKQKEIEVELAKENEKFTSLVEQISSLESELSDLKNSEIITLNKIEIISKELDSISSLEKTVGENKEGANEAIAKRQERFLKLKEKREEASKKLTELRVEIASLKSEIIATTQELERLDSQVLQANQNKENVEQEIYRNNSSIEQSENLIQWQVENSTSSEIKQKLERLKDQQKKLDENKINFQRQLKDLEEKRGFLISEVNKINERKLNEEFKISKVDTDIDSMQDRILEEYQLDYNSCLSLKDEEFDLNKGLSEINKIKKEINKLGYINVAAIEDSKILGDRYDSLSIQIEDLNKAQDELIQIINELSNEMKTRFTEEFNKINENFRITFKELFGGGNAKLELIGSDNILESGVEILAEPPGKKLSSNSLLSGGEKALTAIAILFAILKLRPMPFCLLDEIEAALDEANVYRFAQYLRRFSNETQFIVITHKKPTMELADSLYGVTMEEKGVSKIVSVKLSDAVKFEQKTEN